MWSDGAVVLLFFDQFENVFLNERLTREFRDLALACADSSLPMLIGFAWKTDLVGWTEGHPYQLRDDIRSRASVVVLDPLGPSDINALLSRLTKAIGHPLLPEMRSRLREYSQGLPWLFKKLGSHILTELASGTTQETLLNEALNVQKLFENDLAELAPAENEGLRIVARGSPMLVSDALELVAHAVVRSLIDRRLIVQVGERLDTYWDIFRDFLNTGRVPIQETYILRQTPGGVSRLLDALVAAGGELTVAEAADRLNTSEGPVFNMARDLRQMNLLLPTPGVLRTTATIQAAEDRETVLREQVSQALRRHRAFSILSEEIEHADGMTTIARFAAVLPQAFPAVQATSRTWKVYARAFVHWFEYARLVTRHGARVEMGAGPDDPLSLLGARPRRRSRGVFPQAPPGPTLNVIRMLLGRTDGVVTVSRTTTMRAIHDVSAMRVLRSDSGRVVVVPPDLIDEHGNFTPARLREVLSKLPGVAAALEAADERQLSLLQLGEFVRDAHTATWADSTTSLVGKYLSAWLRLTHPAVRRRRGPRRRVPALDLGIATE